MGPMEHRCGTRQAVSAAVTLYPHDCEPVLGRIQEASISGMFVATAPHLFCENGVIDVEVTVPGTAALRTYRWQAMVVRRTENGLGLMFDRVRPPAIAHLLHARQSEMPRTLPADNVTPLRPARGERQPQL